jgi:coenzyme F420-reducing hydrogenase delta subunit
MGNGEGEGEREKGEKFKEKIKKIEKNLEKIGPVSRTIMEDAAKELGVLKKKGKEVEIEISNEHEFNNFIKILEEKLSKIIGKDITKTLLKGW